jgi:multiple antibiotic resistance protein
MIFSNQLPGWHRLQLLVWGAVIAAAVALAFYFSHSIERLLGKTGINVMTRLMGLVLASLAVEIMAKGLYKLFPILAQGLTPS